MTEVRPFAAERDLQAVLEFVGDSRARGEPGAFFHPGGLQWWLRRLGRPGFDVAVLRDGDAIVGLALNDEEEAILQADAAHATDREALLDWVESQARGADFFVTVPDGDAALLKSVGSRGYAATDRQQFELVHELRIEPSAALLPRGFEMISLTADLADPYVALHRAAWSRPNAPSTYDRRQHDAVTAMPGFRYELVPIVALASGELAAYCMSWWDPRSRSVEIEPLGTHPAHRRLGLARAIVHEVFRRSWTLGARYVMVWGASTNPEAKALYESCGLRARRTMRDWRAP